MGDNARIHLLYTLCTRKFSIYSDMGAEAKQQHEVFNPGYSRASSSNSVTPPVQPPPMATINSATALRSR